MQNLLKEHVWRTMITWVMEMATVNQRKSGPASYLLTHTFCCTCLLLSLNIQNGCFMLILPPILGPSPAKIPYFWEFFHRKRGFRKNMLLWYQVFQQLFTQELLYWLWASRVLQFLLYTGTRSCNFLFRWFVNVFILWSWLLNTPTSPPSHASEYSAWIVVKSRRFFLKK